MPREIQPPGEDHEQELGVAIGIANRARRTIDESDPVFLILGNRYRLVGGVTHVLPDSRQRVTDLEALRHSAELVFVVVQCDLIDRHHREHCARQHPRRHHAVQIALRPYDVDHQQINQQPLGDVLHDLFNREADVFSEKRAHQQHDQEDHHQAKDAVETRCLTTNEQLVRDRQREQDRRGGTNDLIQRRAGEDDDEIGVEDEDRDEARGARKEA